MAQPLQTRKQTVDLAATPILRQRVERAGDIREALFAAIVLADDRAVAETWSGGRCVHPRDPA